MHRIDNHRFDRGPGRSKGIRTGALHVEQCGRETRLRGQERAPYQPRHGVPPSVGFLDFECYKEDVNLDLVNKVHVPVDISEFGVTGLF